ncbi:hypothetical protein DBV15_12830 [Temnothorax longispinosus]|uniref:CCHC-type domain-containing protein n=1 Tax=Temnothorax longispinosus TaxID=300112 RepID=A0A4S2L398_9HYME|nr:hypothetical protein DBV15_12830 [Temnothorax longispinosus]
MEVGHTRAQCSSEKDRTGDCYRCWELGHPARECRVPVRCTVCKDKGLPHDHRVGGPTCKGCKPGKRGKTEEAGKKEEEPTKNKSSGKKPKVTSNLEVRNFEVRDGNKLIAGEVITQDPPKGKRLQKRKPEGTKILVKSDALRIIGVVTQEEPPKEQRPPKRKKEGDKALDKPTDTTVPMDLQEEAETLSPDPLKITDKEEIAEMAKKKADERVRRGEAAPPQSDSD